MALPSIVLLVVFVSVQRRSEPHVLLRQTSNLFSFFDFGKPARLALWLGSRCSFRRSIG